MERLSWKAAPLLFILIVMLVSSSAMFWVVAEDVSGDDLFRFVWDDSLRGYYIVSDEVFPLKVYVLSLTDVGNYRASNHSSVVEGVKQAVNIRPGDSEIKELHIFLWFGLVMKLKVNVSYAMVEDWNGYKTLVESGNNTIIVNTHDEYLPVPEGYTKEGWTDKIADFMLNRWGTWVHAGGYPFYRVWYQNGIIEEWEENGFKRLMSCIGKPNITCYPSPDWCPEDRATFNGYVAQYLGSNWYLYGNSILDFAEANLGYPINWYDYEAEGLFVGAIYSYAQYKPGAVIRFSQNQSTFNFGMYVHLGTWKYYYANGKECEYSDRAIGFISTASGICSEFLYAANKLYGRVGDSAAEVIQEAEKEGRTVGLTEAKSLFQSALDAFASGNYKLSAAYANQAKLTAENATAPNTLPQVIAVIAMIAIPIGVGAYYKINNKKNKRNSVTESQE